jgi:hypothetical protein
VVAALTVGLALADADLVGVLTGLAGVLLGVVAGVLSPGAGSAAAGTPNAVDGAQVSASGSWVGMGPGLFTTAGALPLFLAACAFAVR